MNLPKLFKIFADETRLEVVKHLSNGDNCSCKFENKINVSQPTLAYHLKLIRDSGLATVKKEGTWHKYYINEEAIDEMIQFLEVIKKPTNSNCKSE